jgi:hypothetical protein
VTTLLQGLAEGDIGRAVVPRSFKIITSSVWNSEEKKIFLLITISFVFSSFQDKISI